MRMTARAMTSQVVREKWVWMKGPVYSPKASGVRHKVRMVASSVRICFWAQREQQVVKFGNWDSMNPVDNSMNPARCEYIL